MNWVKWACDWKQFRHFYNELKYISTLNDYTKIDSNVNGRWGNRKLWGVYLTISVISIVHLTTLQHSHYCCCWIHCIHLLLAVADGGYVLLFQESCIKIFFFTNWYESCSSSFLRIWDCQSVNQLLWLLWHFVQEKSLR